MNLAQFLIDTSTRIPAHAAIRFKGEGLTYSEMNRKVDSLAHGLSRLGIRPKDVCILMMPSSPQWTLIYYALAKMGAVAVPVNPLYRQGELIHIFRDCGARAFMGHKDYLGEPSRVMDSMPHLKIRIADGENLPIGFTPLNQLFGLSEEFKIFPTQPDDALAVIYTSGTTGLPKGAVLTHNSLMSDAIAVDKLRHTEPEDIVLSVLPLFHIYGMTHSLNISVYLGLTMRMWEHFIAEEVLAAIEKEESSILYAVPTMINRLVELAKSNPPKRSSLRFVISGGASLPVEILHRFQSTFNATIYESYGLTECSPTCVENPYGRPTRPGSIGLPIPPFRARIADDNDHDVTPGEVGELLIAGPGVMKEYLNQPEATTQALRGGWLHTGDLARMDQEGYIFIVDRKKEMIIRGGYNIYPREIEEVLYKHPSVLEAAVIGVPHADLGEEVAGVIVLRSGTQTTAEELRQFVKDRVAPYKYPRVIKFVKELPKTSTGKIFKRGIQLEG
jgi:long-chain acyl-CoA synthetase